MTLLLRAGRVVTASADHAPGWVHVDGDRVAAVGEGHGPSTPGEVLDLGDAVVTPGFVDVHSHGGGGVHFADGVEAAETAALAHRRHGTLATMASLVTAEVGALAATVRTLAPLVRSGLLAGIHLEGPWLSPRHRGAHDPGLLVAPTPRDVDLLLDAGEGAVRMVTLAPELPGALDAVERLVAAGVVVGVGHTDATYDQTRAAIERGASVGTHVFNAMRGLHHREPGPIGALAQDRTTLLEVIADGVHLHPGVIDLVGAGAPGRVVLVTDAMAAAAAPDGAYRLGSLDVEVLERVARLVDGGAIAGSTLTLDRAVAYAVRDAHLPLVDAVRAATSTPAALLGRPDLGDVVAGGPADLVVLHADLTLAGVMVAGRWLDEPAAARD